MRLTHRNWAGNLTFAAAHLYEPETVAQTQAIVAASAHIHATVGPSLHVAA